MTNWGFDDDSTNDLGNDNELNGPEGLRSAYKAMKKQNEELQKKSGKRFNDWLEGKKKGAATAGKKHVDVREVEEATFDRENA